MRTDDESTQNPERWAALFFAIMFVALVTTPTGSPAAVAHLAVSVIALLVAVWFACEALEKSGY